MSKKKTHSDYVAQVNIVVPNIEVVGRYETTNIKITHRCKVCGYEWSVSPKSVLSGRGCPECAKHNRAKSKTKTHEQYVSEVAATNPDVEIIGKYKGALEKIDVMCKICGNKWSARAADILRGSGCVKCSHKELTKTHSQYVAELADINPDVVAIDEYVNSYTKIKHLCLKCGHEWYAAPNALLHGNHCPECSMHRKPHDQYVEELSSMNPNIDVVGTYINANTNIAHRCKICGYEWLARPSHLLHGLGCPSCHGTSGEQAVRQWLTDNCIRYETQKCFADCKNQRVLPFDFYLPDYNCCVEYDGAQHFREVELWGGKEYLLQRQHNDKIKNDYCQKNNMYLIRIRYDEDVREVLDNKLKLIMLDCAI